MEKTNVMKSIADSTIMLCDAIAEKEGMLNDREYDSLISYVREMQKVQEWCATIRKAECLKKMLKE